MAELRLLIKVNLLRGNDICLGAALKAVRQLLTSSFSNIFFFILTFVGSDLGNFECSGAALTAVRQLLTTSFSNKFSLFQPLQLFNFY